VERANDVSWGVSAVLAVIAAVRKLQASSSSRRAAEAKMDAARAAGRAAEERHARSSRESSAVSPIHRRAVAQASLRPGAPGSGLTAADAPPTASVMAARRREALATAALARAACELVQAGPGTFGLDSPSELLYLLCGLTNGALGVWMAWESAGE